MKTEKQKSITIRLPVPLWRKLKLAVIDGKIKSIQNAVVSLLEKFLK